MRRESRNEVEGKPLGTMESNKFNNMNAVEEVDCIGMGMKNWIEDQRGKNTQMLWKNTNVMGGIVS